MTIKTENWLGEYTSTIGTGDITLGGAIDGFAGFSNVGENVDVYYTIMDALDKETGIGTLTGGKLVRKDIHATLVDGAYVKSGSAINLSGAAQVYGTANAHFLDYVQAVANAEIVNTQAIAELKALQINGHALTASFNLTAADVGAHPDIWMPSTEALNVYQKDASDIRYLKTQDAEQVAGLVMRVGGAREQQLQQSIDGFESRIDEALRRSYAEAGYNLVDGSFEAGGTLTSTSDVLLHEGTGKAYAWHGTYPLGEYIVPPGSTPAEVSWFDASQLAPGAGTVRDGRFALRDFVSVMDFGAKGDGVANCKSAFINAEAEADLIYVPTGTFFVGDFIGTKFFFGPGKIKVASGYIYDAPKSPQVLDFKNPNTVLGLGAIEIGSFNTFLGMNVGYNAGPSATTNVLIGHNLASGDTIDRASNAPFTGYDNVGIGFHALKVAQTAHSNVAIGRDAQNQNKTGSHNITIGVAAGQQLIDIDDNICIGGAAGGRMDAGVGLNTYVGRGAGKENKNGARNTCLGWGSGTGVPAPVANHTGDGVTTTFSAGTIPLTNVKQIRVDVDGINVLPANYSVSGTNVIFNVAPANGATIVLTYTIGSASYNWNTFVGTRTGYVIKSGSYNTFLGASAGENTSVGSNNVNIGYQAGQSNDANGCIFIGYQAGRANVGPDNQFIVANQASLPFLQGNMGPVGDANNVLRCDGSVQPATDNVRASGSSSRRWSVIFAGNGTINTSDAREKTAPLDITDAILDAWGDVQLIVYQWLDAIRIKGDEARWHFGVIAQQVRDAFLAHGIDGTHFGLLCYDEWQDEYSKIQTNAGEIVIKTRSVNGIVEEYEEPADPTYDTVLTIAAGNRWGIRADQCLFLEAAYQRRNYERLLKRVEALEGKV